MFFVLENGVCVCAVCVIYLAGRFKSAPMHFASFAIKFYDGSWSFALVEVYVCFLLLLFGVNMKKS